MRKSKWFEPRSISSSYCVIVRVRLVVKRTVVCRSVRSPFVGFVLVEGKSFVRRRYLLTSVKGRLF